MGSDMILTRDYDLIRSIIERDDILPTFCGKSPSDEVLKNENILYFYDENVGLFPAQLDGKELIFHAAVPKENRGIKAINSIKGLFKDLLGRGYTIKTKTRDFPHIKRFINSIGFEYFGEEGNRKVYILRAL